MIGDSVIAENREDCSFIWENYYDAEGQINEYDLTIFARTENQDGKIYSAVLRKLITKEGIRWK